MLSKVKITQKEFDEIYQIEPEITGEISAVDGKTKVQPSDSHKEDTTPFLTEEEQELDDKYFEDTPMEDIQE